MAGAGVVEADTAVTLAIVDDSRLALSGSTEKRLVPVGRELAEAAEKTGMPEVLLKMVVVIWVCRVTWVVSLRNVSSVRFEARRGKSLNLRSCGRLSGGSCAANNREEGCRGLDHIYRGVAVARGTAAGLSSRVLADGGGDRRDGSDDSRSGS